MGSVRPLCLVLCILVLAFQCLSVDGHSVVKRNAVQMCNLVNMYTGRSCFNYFQYGCFCGYGQQGTQPVDDTDRCCKLHDDCYGEVRQADHCIFWSGLFVGYDFTCQDFKCRCTDTSKCSRRVCECDLQLAICLGKTSLNNTFFHYDRSQCV